MKLTHGRSVWMLVTGTALALAFGFGFMASTAYAGELGSAKGRGGPSLDPVACAEHCDERATKIYDHCVEKGGDEAACATRRDEMLAKCEDRCANPPSRPEPGQPGEPREPREPRDCETLCATIAQRAADACSADPDSKACEHLTKAAAECPERCANPPTRPEPGPGRGGPGGGGGRPGRP